MKENILGYDVNTLSVEACVDRLFQSLQRGKRTCLACFNPHSYVLSLKDERFSRALKAADWLVPDGTGVVLASRLLGGKIQERVTGSDVFAGLHKRMNDAGSMRVFFLGATDETLTLIRNRMVCDYPNIKVAGVYSPPFKDAFSRAEISVMIKAVNSAAPDVLWVGMSAPKQEKFIFENYARLNVKFAAGVGAVFDFYAGTVKRAPVWIQKRGMEWFYRLIQEPGRMWKRYLIDNTKFTYFLLAEKLKK